MQLKPYQERTLEVLRDFFKLATLAGHEEAYRQLTDTPEMRARLGKFRSYSVWPDIADVPRVCIKVPTGGGKTILAAHAIKVAAESWMDVEFPVVLWFVPSDTIRKQTVSALQNPRHPYRKVLDEQFGGRVRVFDIDDKFLITPQDIAGHVCIIISTVQSFKQSDTGKYNVYKHNENLEGHFTHIRQTPGMETDEKGQLKFSFANLMHAHRPLMVMDEAHNAVTGLTEVMQSRLYPSAIIELTATPRPRNNTLYSVYAYELKEEAMIKLPVMLTEHEDWAQCVTQSVVKRHELEKLCAGEREYIRPILLLQAQAKGPEEAVTCGRLKEYLIQELSIPEAEIALATGEQHELDKVDVFDRSCPIRYVITVQALKEGWDCPFAYVLCSVAKLKSNTAIEQLLGRVMRMPYAEFRKTPALNKAYAYVRSSYVGEAARELVARLSQKGFDDTEAEQAIVEQQPVEELPLFAAEATVTLDKEESSGVLQVIREGALSPSVLIRQEPTGALHLTFTKGTSEQDIAALCRGAGDSSETSRKISAGFARYQQAFSALHSAAEGQVSPARQGLPFKVPQLAMEVQGELLPADGETLFEFYDWRLADWASPQLKPDEFDMALEGTVFRVDVDGRRVQYGLAEKEAYLPGFGSPLWEEEQMVAWLVRKLKQQDILHAELAAWVADAVHYLAVERHLPMEGLVINRFRVADKLLQHIRDGRMQAKEHCQRWLLEGMNDVRATVSDEYAVEFAEDSYDDVPRYHGAYRFTKHYTRNVPAFDGKDGGASGEEFACAQQLDALPEVDYWIRNVARHPHSFSLPLANGRFYPDFVVRLQDGRLLVVEYKGGHLASNLDSVEKAAIGNLWAKTTGNLFLMAGKSKNGLGVYQQLEQAIR